MTPLHFAVYGYHVDRAETTCRAIDALLKHGADPVIPDKSGETAPHLAVVKTRDLQVMAKVSHEMLQRS
jgi:ankyrin repeat protein